jgi:ABC-type glycerol-3-phosphate transport system substrate-binding protein
MPASATARRAVIAVVALIGVAACGGSDSASPAVPAAASTAEVPAPLSFTATILGGGQLEGASLAGRAVMLWFWAPT